MSPGLVDFLYVFILGMIMVLPALMVAIAVVELLNGVIKEHNE